MRWEFIKLFLGSNDFSRATNMTIRMNYNRILSPTSLATIFILTSNCELFMRQPNRVEDILLSTQAFPFYYSHTSSTIF